MTVTINVFSPLKTPQKYTSATQIEIKSSDTHNRLIAGLYRYVRDISRLCAFVLFYIIANLKSMTIFWCILFTRTFCFPLLRQAFTSYGRLKDVNDRAVAKENPLNESSPEMSPTNSKFPQEGITCKIGVIV